MIDDREARFPVHNQQLVAHLCHRRFGIGADGLILLRHHADYAFEMIYFNADGKIGSMCGNGGRCVVQFAHDLHLFEGVAHFLAADGPHEAYLQNGLVYLKMSDVGAVSVGEGACFVNTGSPHHVQFVDDVSNFPVVEEGRKIRHSATYQPAGSNVNFVERTKNGLFVRTFERGVEDETYSCGTGVTAAAIVAGLQNGQHHFQIKTLGGNLEVAFKPQADGTYQDIYLIGPAEKVFEGKI